MATGKRWQIGLPQWHEKLLIQWAHAKGVSKTALSQNILQARIEANQKQIESMIGDLASDSGHSVEEYRSKLFEENPDD